MTLHDVRRLSEYAKKNPPLRVLVSYCAAALGVKLPDAKEEKPHYTTAEEARMIMQATGGRIEGLARIGRG